MHIRDFDYDLPAELIAQEPTADRGGARLLHLSRSTAAISHTRIAELPSLLSPGDLVVVNDTRVFPARLLGRRVPSGGAVECLLIGRTMPPGGREDEPGQWWEALMHPGQKLKSGARVVFEGVATIHGEVVERRGFGRRVIRLWTDGGGLPGRGGRPHRPRAAAAVHQAGRSRRRPRALSDRLRGAARIGRRADRRPALHPGAARARCDAAGVELTAITLHVGYGTFQPVRVDEIEEHRLEPERYEIGEHAADGDRARAVRRPPGHRRRHDDDPNARGRGGGATTGGSSPAPERPISSSIRDSTFRVIDGLLTNFHLPRSSLLMLVAAFAGRERGAGRVSGSGGGAVPVLQLRRRDAGPLTEAERAGIADPSSIRLLSPAPAPVLRDRPSS